MIFNSPDKAYRYLDKCFVLAKNVRQGINEVYYSTGGDKVTLHSDGTSLTIKTKDLPDWSFHSPRLGYVYREGLGTWFLQRNPVRSWKVGMSSSSVDSRIFREVETFGILEALRRANRNEYPDFMYAKASGVKLPFSQNYAVKGQEILYQDEVVGRANNGLVVCKSSVSAGFHNRVIGSLTGLTFIGTDKKAVDYDSEDF